MKPRVGDKVKFKDKLWPEKSGLGKLGGLFSLPMTEKHPNEFIINMVNNQGNPDNGEDDFELGLDGYPWLVYFDEMEIIEE